jgi:hydrogenase expression/formation protein HypE
VSPEETLPVGKLDWELLAELLGEGPPPGARTILGPGIGRDVAVLDMGDRYLVAKTDPITFATDEIGYYAVNVNANDVATSGARPLWFLASLLLPENQTTPELVRDIFGQIRRACRALEVELVGGHTEVTLGLDRPILVGQMLGEVAPDELVRPDRLQEDDVVLLTKGIAVEGASIIAREREAELRARGYSGEFVADTQAMLFEPGISVVREARIACETARMHGARIAAMHDPTEGGVATGLWELAEAAGVGLEVNVAAIPRLPAAERLAEEYGLDLLGLIASGALLIGLSAELADPVRQALEAAGIACSQIARAVDAGRGVLRGAEDARRPLPRFDQDEITKLFA